MVKINAGQERKAAHNLVTNKISEKCNGSWLKVMRRIIEHLQSISLLVQEFLLRSKYGKTNRVISLTNNTYRPCKDSELSIKVYFQFNAALFTKTYMKCFLIQRFLKIVVSFLNIFFYDHCLTLFVEKCRISLLFGKQEVWCILNSFPSSTHLFFVNNVWRRIQKQFGYLYVTYFVYCNREEAYWDHI